MSDIRGFLFVVLLVAGVAHAAEPPFLEALSGADAQARARAIERAAEQSPRLIPHVASLLDDPDPAKVRAAELVLQSMAIKATEREEARFEVSQLLSAKALDVRHPEYLLGLLSWCGGEEALISVATMLNTHPQHTAGVLRALEGILRTVRPSDALLAKVLGELELRLESADEATRTALWPVVGMVGGAGALRLFDARLEAIQDDVSALAERELIFATLAKGGAFRSDTALLAAEHPYQLLLFAERQPDEAALALYEQLLAAASKPQWVCAALLGIGRCAGSARDAAALIPYLSNPQADVAGSARDALLAVKDERIAGTVSREARKASPEALPLFLEVLDVRDPEAAEKLRAKYLP